MALQDQTTRLGKGQLLLIFLGIQLALFLAYLDSTSVSTALTEIANSLGAANNVGWVGGSYLVAQIATLCTASRLSDIFGRKVVLLACLALFAIGDILCGFAQTPIWLFLSRSVSGAGAGGMTSLSMVIVSDVVSMRKRGMYQGVLGVAVALGMAIGPFLGGGFAEKISWRWCFWISPPLAVITMLIIYFLLPLPHVTGAFRDKLAQIDWVGGFLSVLGVVLILVPISGGGSDFAWDSPLAISMLCIGTCVLVAFLVVEARFAPLPILPLHIFRIRTVAVLLLQTFLSGIIFFGNLYFVPIYTQNVLGYTPIMAGALLLPLVLIQTVTSTLGGLFVQISGKNWPCIVGGFGLAALGQGLQIMFSRETPIGQVIGILLMQGIGIGFFVQTTLVLMQAASPPIDRAVVTGARNFFRTTGGAIGLAVANSLLNNRFASLLPQDISPALRQQLTQSSFQLPASLDPATRVAIIDAYGNALQRVFIFFFVPMAFCLGLCCLLKEVTLQDDPPDNLESGRGAPDSSATSQKRSQSVEQV